MTTLVAWPADQADLPSHLDLYVHLNPGDERCAPEDAIAALHHMLRYEDSVVLVGTIQGALVTPCTLVVMKKYIHEATGFATVAAFDSGNLELIALDSRDGDPARSIIIAGDKDHHLPRQDHSLPNVRLAKAAATAQAVAGIVLTPSFAPTDKGTDWNDYAARHGKASLRLRLRRSCAQQGLPYPPSQRQRSRRRLTKTGHGNDLRRFHAGSRGRARKVLRLQ